MSALEEDLIAENMRAVAEDLIAENMRALPDDLITEILLRLPAKSLLRFRCVRKSWNHLIRSSDFINIHLKHHSTKKECILISCRPENQSIPHLSLISYDSLDLISADFQIPEVDDILFGFDFHIDLCGPCNGLVCISMNNQDIMLCNPFLREFKLLPSRPFPSPPAGYRSHDEGFGFWFDSGTKNYKVLRIVKHTCDDEFVSVEIYNSSTNSWRLFENHKFDNQNRLALSPGAMINEVVYWVNNNEEVLSFDMKTEVFHTLIIPEDLEVEEPGRMWVTVLNESLALFSVTEFWTLPQFIELWKMEEYGNQESWTKLCTVGPLSLVNNPLLFWKDEAIIYEGGEIPFDMYDQKGKLLACSTTTMKIEDLINGRSCFYRALICNESLVSIK